MSTSKIVGICFLGLVVILGLTWIGQGNNFFLYKVFAPQYEQVRRETFEESKAYNQGMVQELQNMQFKYEQADQSGKDALRPIILHRAADYPEDKMPQDLKQFIHKLKDDQKKPFK